MQQAAEKTGRLTILKPRHFLSPMRLARFIKTVFQLENCGSENRKQAAPPPPTNINNCICFPSGENCGFPSTCMHQTEVTDVTSLGEGYLRNQAPHRQYQ